MFPEYIEQPEKKVAVLCASLCESCQDLELKPVPTLLRYEFQDPSANAGLLATAMLADSVAASTMDDRNFRREFLLMSLSFEGIFTSFYQQVR